MVEGEGFEPSKAEPTDLQSVPFDRSGTPPTKLTIVAISVPYCQTKRACPDSGDPFIYSQVRCVLSGDASLPKIMTAWDYVIVGAGSAGCVLANRLTAGGRYSVLLLEAGPTDANPWIHIPIGYAKTMFHPTLNWRFKTEPEPSMNGREVYWPRGRTLGGSSSINGLIYIRGQPQDYDQEDAAGLSGTSGHVISVDLSSPDCWRHAVVAKNSQQS